MNNTAMPVFMQPQWFLPLFAAMWFGITGLLAHMGGWTSLAAKFRAIQAADGQRFRFVSGSMGKRFLPVRYENCLFVTVNTEGFYLSILFPFRFQCPPLFIPWTDIESVTERRFLFIFRYVTIAVKGHWSQISIRGRAANSIQRAFIASAERRSNQALKKDAPKDGGRFS
jgi:hypothetical protein